MALYSPEHPTVKGAVADSLRLLGALLDEQGEIVVSTSEGKVIVNGRPPEEVADAALKPFFQLLTAHELHSLSFIKGIDAHEMATFFRLAAGGELPASMTYLHELSIESKYKNLICSLVNFGALFGVLLSSL